MVYRPRGRSQTGSAWWRPASSPRVPGPRRRPLRYRSPRRIPRAGVRRCAGRCRWGRGAAGGVRPEGARGAGSGIGAGERGRARDRVGRARRRGGVRGAGALPGAAGGVRPRPERATGAGSLTACPGVNGAGYICLAATAIRREAWASAPSLLRPTACAAGVAGGRPGRARCLRTRPAPLIAGPVRSPGRRRRCTRGGSPSCADASASSC
jgi:hypothetical protein